MPFLNQSNLDKHQPDEALIALVRKFYGRIGRYKGTKAAVIQKIREFSDFYKEHKSQSSWFFEQKEKELGLFLKNTFFDSFLYDELTKNIPDRVRKEVENKVQSTYEQHIVLFLSLLGDVNRGKTINNLQRARQNVFKFLIVCIENEGLLESEINKRSVAVYGRYHILLTLNGEGRKKKIIELFLTKQEVEELHATWAEKGVAMISGSLVYVNTIDKLTIWVGLIQKEEKELYYKKYGIRTDEAFMKRFEEVTRSFHNNTWLNNITHTLQPKTANKPDIGTNNNDKYPNKMEGIEGVKALIGDGELESAIQVLKHLAKHTSFSHDVILLESRYNNNARKYRLGTLSEQEYTLERNKIAYALLNTCSEVEMLSSAESAIPKVKLPATPPSGYCIRTGQPIPFNLERPLSLEAFREWAIFCNEGYPERFCHFSGEPSGGETSFALPILKKNWKKAKEVHKF